MPFSQIGPISIAFPEKLETCQTLLEEHPEWKMAEIKEKTGVDRRYIAAPQQTAGDLAVAASEKLIADFAIDRSTIDFVMLCTQTPDYVLPTTACLIQDRLSLPTTCGALDFNLGCSGFIYGLALADGLIQSGNAKRILLLTAETYSKYIDKDDRSLRTIFGDAAAASLIESSETPSLTAFQFGTDGSGADTLMVADGGARAGADVLQPRHRKRWNSRLYMDGPSLIEFSVKAVPALVDQVLQRAQLSRESIDLYLLHQATRKMLSALQECLDVSEHELPIRLDQYGNTVSATLPILISDLRREGRIKKDAKNMLVGFGVGWSWAGCLWTDSWHTNR